MAFDELYSGDVIRPLYRKYLLKNSELTLAERKRALKAARACVSGDAHFLPLVRLITDREYRELVAGVRQRGRALRMFLTDHYFGGRSYEGAGIFKRSQVDKILSRYVIAPDQPALRPENIQFWYAPDIVRDEDGNFRVIEDNVGFVGGMGDLEALTDAMAVLGVSIPSARHPRSFYEAMVESYRREALSSGGGKTVLLSYPRSERHNREDDRLERVLGALNVTPVTNFRRLKVRDDGLFHRGERVGFVIINVKPEDIDPMKSADYRISRFWHAVNKGQLGVSYAPGLHFVSDKNFCPNVEALVNYYLNTKCLLPSLPVLNLEKSRSFQKVQKEREHWVVKLCRGQSGESVWVGPHLTPRAWTNLLIRVQKRPGDFVAQRYCEPSRFLGHTVDLRPLAIITSRGERVSSIPWGRAAKSRKSKTNIACGGLLAPVAVVSSLP